MIPAIRSWGHFCVKLSCSCLNREERCDLERQILGSESITHGWLMIQALSRATPRISKLSLSSPSRILPSPSAFPEFLVRRTHQEETGNHIEPFEKTSPKTSTFLCRKARTVGPKNMHSSSGWAVTRRTLEFSAENAVGKEPSLWGIKSQLSRTGTSRNDQSMSEWWS